MSDPLKTAQDAAHAAIARLADAGHRAATEHAHALDLLRAQVESLRAINAALRHRIEVLERGPVAVQPVDTGAPREVVRGFLNGKITHWSPDGSRWAQHEFQMEKHGWHRCTGFACDGPMFLSAEEKDRWLIDDVLPENRGVLP